MKGNFGHANTKIFHTTTLKRQHCNRIVNLRGPFGNWITDTIALTSHILSHFQKIFVTSSISVPNHNPLPCYPLRISDSEGLSLTQAISESEIIQTIKLFKPLKAQDLNGIHHFFFHKFLTNILPAITLLFNSIFISKQFPSKLKSTFIELIPKSSTPETIN